MPIDIVVESYVLDELFEALDVWTKINDGFIRESLGPEPPARARTPWCPGGISYFTRLSNRHGYRLGRIHYLDCPQAGVLRWPSHLIVGDVKILRHGHQQRPA